LKDALGEENFEKYKRFALDKEIVKSDDKMYCAQPGCGTVLHIKSKIGQKLI